MLITNRNEINEVLHWVSKVRPIVNIVDESASKAYTGRPLYVPDMSLHSTIKLNADSTFAIEKDIILDLDDLAPEFFGWGDPDAKPSTFHTFRPPHVIGVSDLDPENESIYLVSKTIFVSRIDVPDDEYIEELRHKKAERI